MFEKFKLYFQKLDYDAIIPRRANNTDAGMDLFALEEVYIRANSDAIIKTGLRCKFSNGFVMIFKDKSGRSVKDKLTVGAGVIDSEYRGELMIHMYNNSNRNVTINKGEKAAQFVIFPIWIGQPYEINEISIETSRGEGGFGSSGLNE